LQFDEFLAIKISSILAAENESFKVEA